MYSQVEVSSRLQQALLEANQNDYVKVLVLLRSQVDLASLDQQLYEQKSSIQQRAYQVITALKQNKKSWSYNKYSIWHLWGSNSYR